LFLCQQHFFLYFDDFELNEVTGSRHYIALHGRAPNVFMSLLLYMWMCLCVCQSHSHKKNEDKNRGGFLVLDFCGNHGSLE
jgi:hypothetical protein